LAEPGVNAFTELFSVEGLAVLKGVPDEESSVHPLSWQGRLKRSLHEVYVEDGNPPWDRLATLKRYSFDLSKLEYPERVLVMWDFDQLDKLRPHLSPELAACGQEELLRTIFRNNLLPRPELAAEAAGTVPHDGSMTVGAHVRATHEASRQKGLVPLNVYFRLVDKLSADGARVVLATDNKEVEDLFRRRYRHVITKAKWFAVPGEPLHLDSACPDRLQNTRDAAVELLMLARCDYLITQQNSSFSMMARVTSRAPAENIISLHSRMPFLKRMTRYWKRVVREKVGS